MEKRPVIGVMGGGTATPPQLEAAYRLGKMVAAEDWILLNGGRNTGIMEASARGARDQGGITVGILPDATPEYASEYITIPIVTGMGNARNCINVLSSDVVVACPGGAGTVSEIAIDAGLEGILDGIEEFSHIMVLYWAHLAPVERRSVRKVHPFGNKDFPLVGVFATHSPVRPNPSCAARVARPCRCQGRRTPTASARWRVSFPA